MKHAMRWPVWLRLGLGVGLGAALLSGAPAWAQKSPATPSSEKSAAPAAEASSGVTALTPELFNEILLGEIYGNLSEPAKASSLLLDAARRSGDHRLYKRAVESALRSRSSDNALAAARAWVQADPTSREANAYVLQLLILMDRIDDAGDALGGLLAATKQPQRNQMIDAIPDGLARAKNKAAASAAAEKALTPYLNMPDSALPAWMALARTRFAAEQTDAALQALTRGHQANPKAEEPALLSLIDSVADKSEAQTIRQGYIASGAKPTAGYWFAHARWLGRLERNTEAMRDIDAGLKLAPDAPEGWRLKALLSAGMGHWGDVDKSIDQLSAVLKKSSTDGRLSDSAQGALNATYWQLAVYAESKGDVARSRHWQDKIVGTGGFEFASRRAALAAKQGRVDEALKLVRSSIATNAAEERTKTLVEAQLLGQAKRYSEAQDLLGKAFEQNPTEYEWRHQQAMMAEKAGKLDDMERLLRANMAAQPKDPQAYNALGYTLADRNVRLPEARQLIEKALALAPDNPAIMDSMGWVLFRQGNTAEAITWLQRAWQKLPEGEVAAHLGEALWTQGDRDGARAIWRQGLKAGSDAEVMQETLKRLGVTLQP